MTEDELLDIAKNTLAKYRTMPYAELVQKVGNIQPEAYSLGSPKKPDFYQLEVEVVFDDKTHGNLRVICSIDDGKGLYGVYNLIFSSDGSLLSEGGNVRSHRRDFFFKPALSLFRLRELHFSDFAFPRWQAALAITLIGVLAGLDPAMRAGTPEMPGLPLAAAIALGLLLAWVGFLIVLAFLKWWMKRGGRWDGQGDLFNLVAASWFIADVLGAGLAALGLPPLLTLPLWVYSIWVGGNALSGAIPKASLGYAIGGIVLALIPMFLIIGLLMGGLGFAAVGLGLIPAPPAP